MAKNRSARHGTGPGVFVQQTRASESCFEDSSPRTKSLSEERRDPEFSDGVSREAEEGKETSLVSAKKSGSAGSLTCIVRDLARAYLQRYPPRILMMDAFCACLLLMAGLLVLYAVLTRSTFPFNAFLSAFISCVGTAVLTVCFRIQITNKSIFKLTEERALADFLLCSLLLQVAVFTFIG
ncbi:DAD family protein [Toxoplasma gondii ME49]|uniref:Dolichyl-diphosphooligosaccharide--protein glycosyltransferase subunit OST2 n=15 Tax=Toxoplasma gondii TaxID=5811 RepID=A0A125YH46_TOXGV|nr:DAD family protein [Toxoplasma gondii ME49]EPR57392.1 DAD family protein [Toxoplasma gondii GT1]ESS29091.1 DAD family protein [Toxoplasma gondii VEG]KAF4644749.1 DAD family protein [Toxoplasma gondii]KFG30356.1 DAD family protein [Toxoplasma gondii p89]KFG33437.1 DAD family protein [Toxoplasma gondii GAB2-2007-GAL-DOM2]KFG45072.1 DAD family protein [Toxoplasma gondii FOU]KFG59305.1 DAD family protein [Toxoplasma gondii RUB]PUA86036.1 DAD family protein [Toxoplasma gondii TgCATBr9]RQX679|eukprot:XP_018636152.1 DAD family protein [Toxoplasma gondii ME49]